MVAPRGAEDSARLTGGRGHRKLRRPFMPGKLEVTEMDEAPKQWRAGEAPVAVVMIALNEEHHLREALENLKGWAQEVFLVDSYSTDQTVDIALEYGIQIVQRRFRGFGDQWNFALENLPIQADWTMKLDPDERLTPQLKREIIDATNRSEHTGYTIPIHLNFMGRRLPHVLRLVRLWTTGSGKFSDVLTNEHLQVSGSCSDLVEEIDHLDSPDLEHWISKQNHYSSTEAIARHRGDALSADARLLGTSLERRMWLKTVFWKIPFRYTLIYLYHLLVLGSYRAGHVGFIWARLRAEIFRVQEYKLYEIGLTGRPPIRRRSEPGAPDPRVPQYE